MHQFVQACFFLSLVLFQIGLVAHGGECIAQVGLEGSPNAPDRLTQATGAPGLNMIPENLRSDYLQRYSLFQQIYLDTLREQSRLVLGLSTEAKARQIEDRYRAWRNELSRWAETNKVKLLWIQCTDCPLYHPIIAGRVKS